MADLHLLDANVLIRANAEYYPMESVPQFWDWIVLMGTLGDVKMPLEIHDEVASGTDNLAKWIREKSVATALILGEAPDRAIFQRVIDEGYGLNLTDSDYEKIGRDPFLITYGLQEPGRIVVTKEISAPNKQRANRKIPDVCNTCGVSWMNDFALFKKLRFTTK